MKPPIEIRMRKFGILVAAMVMLVVPVIASAALFTATNGSNLSASADFAIVGGQLRVILTNTSSSDVLVPADLLTALFFSVSGATLTPVSANLSGSAVLFGPDGGGNVGGEWAYASGLSSAPHGANSGISSSGFGLFGGFNFGGPNLDPPDAVNGFNYGITSAGDNPATGNAAVTGGEPLIKNQVTFLLGYSGTLDLTNITNVSFQYGTALTEPNIQVPEASTLILLGSGLLGLAGYGRRRLKR